MGFWAKAEEAIRVWVRDSAGLPDDRVFWANQRTPNPRRPCVKLKRISHLNVGGVGGEIRTETTAPDACGNAPMPGEEITVRAVARRAFVVSLQAFTGVTVGDGRETEDSDLERTAVDYLARAENALVLPGQIEKFDAAGIVSIRTSAIRDLPDDKPGVWISRATMDVQFNYTDGETATEKVGVIDEVIFEGDFDEVDP